MIINFGTMGKIISCDVCGISVKVEAWYDIKKAMAEHGYVKVGSTKNHKVYCKVCKEDL